MKQISLAFTTELFFFITGFAPASGQATNDVLTYHNDIQRSGVYTGETVLRATDINTRRFGKVFARRVLGQIWGQPLYVHGVPVAGRLRNIVYVATSENMVYGFDADDRSPDEQTKALLIMHLGAPVAIGEQSFYTILPSNGISSTPVIDLGNPPDPRKGTLYVVAKLNQDKKFHLFALELTTLAIRPNAQGELTGVIVTGTAGQEGRIIFGSSDHLNRPALLISNGHLIIAFGSGPNNDGDAPKFYGWVMSYSLPGLAQTGVFVTTPEAGMGGIWQAGSGPAADDQGNIYFMTGNGHFQGNGDGQPDLSDAFVKLANSDGSLKLVDWYAPPSRDVLEASTWIWGHWDRLSFRGKAKCSGQERAAFSTCSTKRTWGKPIPHLVERRGLIGEELPTALPRRIGNVSASLRTNIKHWRTNPNRLAT